MFLFFIRHFNDIDHLTPIIWKMKRGNHSVSVYCLNPEYDIKSDYRLCFLKELGITVTYVYDIKSHELGRKHQLLRRLSKYFFSIANYLKRLKSSSLPSSLNGITTKITRYGKKIHNYCKDNYYDAIWAYGIIKGTNARAVCFDHIRPDLYVVRVILEASQRLSIPTVALPHGVHLYTNDMTKPKSEESRRLNKFNQFDYIIATNQLRKVALTQSGVASEKISVLGSARYCDEWMNQNSKILPQRTHETSKNSGLLKLVFFPSKPQCNMDLERMSKTINILSDLEGIQLKVKPHTRTAIGEEYYKVGSRSDATEILTAELCEWADAILVVGSSVITEALMRNKPALYLKYLHTNSMLFDDFQACWTINDEQELIRAVKSLISNTKIIPYDRNNVDLFLSETVYGGNLKKNILEAYEQFIVKSSIA